MTVLRMFTMYSLFGNASPMASGKYFEISDHSLLFLQLDHIRLDENSFQFGRCWTQRTSDFFMSFFLPLSTSFPNVTVIYLAGGVYLYMWLLKKSSITDLLGHFSMNLLGAILYCLASPCY